MTSTPFRQRYYERYVSQHQGTLEPARRYPVLKRDVVARLPSDRSARILDAGCGQGDLIALTQGLGWTNVTGVDTSAEQVDVARARGIAGVVQGDIFHFATAHPGEFDVVLAMDLLEHFDREDALKAFSSVRRMLAPGGYLILQVPNGMSPFSGRIYWSDITHGMQYTPVSLAQVCSAAGFDSVACFPVRPAVHGPISALRASVWRVIESFLWLAIAAETGQHRDLVLTQNLVAVAHTSCTPGASPTR